MKNQELTRIIQMLHNIYEGEAWHGPAIKEGLKDITPQQALARVSDSHNIAELVWHMVAWRNFVIRRLQGDEEYELSEEENFKKISVINEEDWASGKEALEESQQKLINLLNQTNDEKLLKIVGNRPYNYYTLLHGIIHHDIYHLGQIILLKKQRQ